MSFHPIPHPTMLQLPLPVQSEERDALNYMLTRLEADAVQHPCHPPPQMCCPMSICPACGFASVGPSALQGEDVRLVSKAHSVIWAEATVQNLPRQRGIPGAL
ncbi:hypothetical protein KIL84_022894 [Mauremys mutica]|uniref:Uncharacterized protein n=1 Tax=Mauremys mutica TaxID=74926 RepID=A0A9D3WQP2_9SAUR|nr:hypothetical protein KIL84_022894 [Mauremys mutica]